MRERFTRDPGSPYCPHPDPLPGEEGVQSLWSSLSTVDCRLSTSLGSAVGWAGAAGALGRTVLGRLRTLAAVGRLARPGTLRGGFGPLLAFVLRLRLLLADGLDASAGRPARAVGKRFLFRRLVLRLEPEV